MHPRSLRRHGTRRGALDQRRRFAPVAGAGGCRLRGRACEAERGPFAEASVRRVGPPGGGDRGGSPAGQPSTPVGSDRRSAVAGRRGQFESRGSRGLADSRERRNGNALRRPDPEPLRWTGRRWRHGRRAPCRGGEAGVAVAGQCDRADLPAHAARCRAGRFDRLTAPTRPPSPRAMADGKESA